MFRWIIYYLFLMGFSLSASAQKEPLPKAVQIARKAIYRLKTPSSEGMAIAVGEHFLLTSFHNLLNVSDLSEIQLSRPKEPPVSVEAIKQVSFFEDIVILETKTNLKNFLKQYRGYGNIGNFYLLGYHKDRVQWTFMKCCVETTSNFKKVFGISKKGFQNFLSGAPLINTEGELRGMVHHSGSERVTVFTTNPYLKNIDVGFFRGSLDAIEKEKKAIQDHMREFIADENPLTEGKKNVFHLRKILEYGMENFKELTYSYLRKGAFQKNREAQFHLGLFSIIESKNLFHNLEMDLTWLRQAATEHVEAQWILSMIYTQGIYSNNWVEENGLNTNPEEAAKWMKQVADKGYVEAEYYVGYFYLQGWGVPKDFNKASAWLERAALKGHAGAQVAFAILLDEVGEEKKSQKWFRKAAEQGNTEAQFVEGSYLMVLAQEKNSKENIELGTEFLKKAAYKGHREAQFMLGMLFEKADKQESQKWFKRAAKKGHSGAQLMLDQLCGKIFNQL